MPSPSYLGELEELEEMAARAKQIKLDGGADRRRPYFYLAGAMTGLPQFNFPEFDRVAKTLRDNGYNLLNPAELGTERERMLAYENPNGVQKVGPDAPSWADCMRRDLNLIQDPNCVGIICMDTWFESNGARLETWNAHKLGLPIFAFNEDESGSLVLIEFDREDFSA